MTATQQRYVRPYRRPVSGKYGAPQGRPEQAPHPGDERQPALCIARVPMVDHDYDAGGAYWGGIPAMRLYCAWTSENPDVAIWERALSLPEAQAKMLKRWSHIKFKGVKCQTT